MRQRPGFIGRLKSATQHALHRLGLRDAVLPPEARRHLQLSHDMSVPLPRGATQTLRTDHPRLQELRGQYAALDWPVCRHTFWAPETVAREVQLPWFRGDNAFVWQYRQLGVDARLKMLSISEYVESRDRLGLLGRLREDGLFGCWTFEDARARRVSRDLLDSVNEINFLERALGISGQQQLRVADIGAGYGRLAHRMCTALPNVTQFDCFDAVAESTFLCDYYIRFRGVQDRARAIALPDVERALPGNRYALALNIHSFSECTLDGIRWWLQRLAQDRTPHLLIVPNHFDQLLSAELDGSQRDYAPLLEESGYRLRHKEPIYDDPAVRERAGIRDFFMLYERRP